MRDMAHSDLSEFEDRLYRWLCQSDFEEVPWSTAHAAKAFKVKQDEIYKALSALTRKIPNNIQIFYQDGGLRIAAE